MSTTVRTLLLITASSPEIQRVRRPRVLNFQQITMPYLAAFAPPHWKVIHIDEVVSPVDFGMLVDLVAITFHTPSAPHAYAMADQFRQRGTPVVLGGPHVTLMPDEAQGHADVIFVGEAESHWPQFLREFEAGHHRQRYCSTEPPSLEGTPMARKDLFHRRDHTAGVLFATRGCPHYCDFCTVAVMYQSRVRKRRVEAVAEEYGSFPGKVIILWDDNIASDETLDFLEAAGVQNATFNILTPFPGTRLYQRLEAEGRILTRNWSKYNGRADVVFRPRLMSPEQLLAGYEYANKRFYSWRSVCKRLARSPVGLSWTLPLNLAYMFAPSINSIAGGVRLAPAQSRASGFRGLP